MLTDQRSQCEARFIKWQFGSVGRPSSAAEASVERKTQGSDARSKLYSSSLHKKHTFTNKGGRLFQKASQPTSLVTKGMLGLLR